MPVDVWILPEPWGPEWTTLAVPMALIEDKRADIRPVFCDGCRRHYTTVVPPGPDRVPTVVHYTCAACGGNGQPASLAVPR